MGIAAGLGLLLGFAADRAFGDPRRAHPVAGFGRSAAALERVVYRDSRLAGTGYAVVLVGGATLVGATLPGAAGIALATWTVLGGTTLTRTGSAMADHLASGDVGAARELLPSLCGRDPSVLDTAGLTRAALESVAENTSDATIAPLVWGAFGGSGALFGYRAVNTLDAMVGYRNTRYERFGWAAARLDDVANYIPARLTGALIVASAPVVGGRPRDAWHAWRRDAAAHPSPNAGVVEAAMAGALGIGLGGRTEYAHGVEIRPVLGDGRAPEVDDLRRAVRLSSAVQVGAALLSAAGAVAIGELVRHRDRRRGGFFGRRRRGLS